MTGAARLFQIARAAEGFDPSQLRDDRGRWTLMGAVISTLRSAGHEAAARHLEDRQNGPDIRRATGRTVAAGGSVASLHLPSRKPRPDDRVVDTRDARRLGTVATVDHSAGTMRVHWDDGTHDVRPQSSVTDPLHDPSRSFDAHPLHTSPAVRKMTPPPARSPQDQFRRHLSDEVAAGRVDPAQAADALRAAGRGDHVAAAQGAVDRLQTPTAADPGPAFERRARVASSGARALDQTHHDFRGPAAMALEDYQADSAARANDVLREHGGDLDRLRPDDRKVVRDLDEAIARAQPTKRDIVVYRGVDSRTFGGQDPVPGFEFTDHGFVATTARGSADERFSSGGVEMRVLVPRGTVAISNQDLLDDDEVLLGRGHRFRVVADRGSSGGIRRLDVELVTGADGGTAQAHVDTPQTHARGNTMAEYSAVVRGGTWDTDPSDFERASSLPGAPGHQTDTGGRISREEAGRRMFGDAAMAKKTAPKAAKKASPAARPAFDAAVLSSAEEAHLRDIQRLGFAQAGDTSTGAARQRTDDLDMLARRGLVRRSGRNYTLTDRGRAALGVEAAPKASPAAAKMARGKAATPPVSITAGELSAMTSREQGHAAVASLSKPELVTMARELHIARPTTLKAAELRREIVDATIGRKVDSIATRGFRGDIHSPEPLTAMPGHSRSPAAAKMARAAKAAPAKKATAPAVSVTKGELTAMVNREQAAAALAPMKKPELLALATELSIPRAKSRSAVDLRQAIVEATVGNRIDGLARSNGFRLPY